MKETKYGYQPKPNNIDKTQTPDCESFVILPIEHEYEQGFEAGYVKGKEEKEDALYKAFQEGVESGSRTMLHQIICFMKAYNNGEKFQQDWGVGDVVNKLCDKYNLPELKYSDKELDDMEGTSWREPMSNEDFCSFR